MNRKKINRRNNCKKNKHGTTRVRFITMASAWSVMALLLIALVVRHVYAEHVTSSHSKLTADDYSLVVVCDSMPDYRIDYEGHRVYFNPEWHIPIAVVYELLESETHGTVPRHKNFERDNSVVGCASPTDYTNSGYDRGHMAPAGDMKWSKAAMHHSFLMTNICPQNKSLNTGIWNQLENKVRQWAQRDSSLIVISGPIVSDKSKRLKESGVVVPDAFYKAVFAPYIETPRAIGFIFPNQKCKNKLNIYAVPIDEIERKTGLDLFSAMPDDEKDSVESEYNYEIWNQRN